MKAFIFIIWTLSLFSFSLERCYKRELHYNSIIDIEWNARYQKLHGFQNACNLKSKLSPYTSNINNSKLNAEDMNTHTTLDAKSSEWKKLQRILKRIILRSNIKGPMFNIVYQHWLPMRVSVGKGKRSRAYLLWQKKNKSLCKTSLIRTN